MANYPEDSDSDESVAPSSGEDVPFDDLPFTDAELWPEKMAMIKIPEEPQPPLQEFPPVPLEERGWETEATAATKDTLDRRMDALKTPIEYDEDIHILPVIDPTFVHSPPPLPVALDEERSAWSLTMVGVALAFLVAANYMPG